MNAALYVRVSTPDQTTENQELQLRAWAEQLGFPIRFVFAETASGGSAGRSALKRLLEAARQRQFDVLLLWSLDRLTREGIGPMLRYMEEFRRLGIVVKSYKESWLDTESPVWELLLAVFAWVAQHERHRLRERIRAGMARAKAHGAQFGRPARPVNLALLLARRKRGDTWRSIARSLHVPRATLQRAYKAALR